MTRSWTVGGLILAFAVPFAVGCKDKKAEEAEKKRLAEEAAKKAEDEKKAKKEKQETLRETILECNQKCQNNLRGLGLALIQYSNENRFFPHMKSFREKNKATDVAKVFRTLVYYKYVDTAEIFVCPGSNDQFIERDPEVLDNPKRFQWKSKAASSSIEKPIKSGPGPDIYKDKDFKEVSYTYRSTLLNSSRARSNTVLAVDRYPHHKNKKGEWGYNVLYGDGHVDFVPVSDQAQLLLISERLIFERPGSKLYEAYKKDVMDPLDEKLGTVFEDSEPSGKKKGKGLIGGFLSSVLGAKEKAKRTKCANQLRGVGIAMIMYSNDYRFYPHMKPLREENKSTDVSKIFQTLVFFKYLDDPSAFVCPSSPDRALLLSDDVINNPKLFQWKNAPTKGRPKKPVLSGPGPDIYKDKDFHQLSYTCYRKRINSSSARSDTIIAADRFPHHWDGSNWGYNVVYADGHVSFVSLDNTAEISRLQRFLHLARPGSKAYEDFKREHMKD